MITIYVRYLLLIYTYITWGITQLRLKTEPKVFFVKGTDNTVEVTWMNY